MYSVYTLSGADFPPGAGLPGYATVAREEPTARCERVLGYCASRSDHVKSNLLVTSVVVLNLGSLDEKNRLVVWSQGGDSHSGLQSGQHETRVPAVWPLPMCPCSPSQGRGLLASEQQGWLCEFETPVHTAHLGGQSKGPALLNEAEGDTVGCFGFFSKAS